VKRPGTLLFIAGLAVGLTVGFGLGVLSVGKAREMFVAAFTVERDADVDHPRDLVRPAFALKYPGNWHIDTKETDYDADHHFTIDSAGQSDVRFTLAEGDLEPRKAVDAMVDALTAKVMPDASRTPMHRWGAYDGEGVALAGKKLGLSPGTLRVFAFRAGGRTIVVIESTFDEDRAMVSPGFELVERTFHVTNAVAAP
jgi:hypothetical protein